MNLKYTYLALNLEVANLEKNLYTTGNTNLLKPYMLYFKHFASDEYFRISHYIVISSLLYCLSICLQW
jgi:hypothetical protein